MQRLDRHLARRRTAHSLQDHARRTGARRIQNQRRRNADANHGVRAIALRQLEARAGRHLEVRGARHQRATVHDVVPQERKTDRVDRATDAHLARRRCGHQLLQKQPGRHGRPEATKPPRGRPRARHLADAAAHERVRVRAHEGKRAHAADALRGAALGQPNVPAGNVRAARMRVQRARHVRVHRVQVQQRNLTPPVELLEQAKHAQRAGRGLRVAHARLDGAQVKRARSVGAHQHRGDRANLDRIAKRRAGAVHLQRADLRGGHARAAHRALDRALLRRAVRSRQAARAAVLVHRAAVEEHAVRRARGRGRVLQEKHAAALAANVAVSHRVQRLAATVLREHPRRDERRGAVRIQRQVRAGHHSVRRLAGQQRPVTQVRRDQRR